MGRIEYIVGKEQNARYQHFLLFPQCFQKPSLSGSLKVGIARERVNSLPNDKILDLSKFKVFADDNFNLTKMVKFFFDKVESLVGKGGNTGYQHFFPFPTMFSKALFLYGLYKS